MHQDQRQNYRTVAEAVDEEAISFTDRGNHNARQRWSNQPGPIHHRRVERDRVPKILFVLYHLHKERLPSRHIECVNQPLQYTQRDDLVDRNQLRQRQPCQRQRLQPSQSLSPYKQPSAVHPFNQNARERRKHEGQDLPGKSHHPEQHRRVRQPPHQPARRQPRHPRANQRDTLPGNKQFEVAVLQRPPGMRESARLPC